MEAETSCDDPQFMNMLETCLRVEIDAAKNTLSGLVAEIKELKAKVQTQLRTRKERKERTKNAQENGLVLTAALNKQYKGINELSDKIELWKLNLDNDYKVMQLECQRHQSILKEYEKTWQQYHAKYEEYPLAKVRKEARIKLQMIRIEEMVIAQRIVELEKISRQRDLVTWLRLRGKIVDFSRAISNHTQLCQTLKDSKKRIACLKEELDDIDRELATRLKTRAEEKNARALKLLEMPPPRINISYMHTIYGSRSKAGPIDDWKRNYENSLDTLSVDTMMLEEMCMSDENPVRTRRQNSDRVPYGKNDASEGASMTARRPCRNRGQEEMERDEAASEMDENTGPEAIDAQLDEEAEELEQEQPEEVALPSSVRRDKQTVAREEDRSGVAPAAKRVKLISGEDKAARTGSKRDQMADAAAGPRITNIEAVRYGVSPMRKMDRGEPKISSNQLAGPSPGPRASKTATSHFVSPMRKLSQANPNPASMFTPRHFDFSDNSNMSFCVDNNMAALKDDQISLYGGSVRDFCECSNISTPMGNPEVDPAEEANENAPSTSRTHDFPKFDFSNILKGNPGRNLF